MKILGLEHLDEIKRRGLNLTYPGKIKIMVGMATCGISAGADKVFQALAGKIEKDGMEVVLDTTGCIGFCQKEPLVDVVYPGKVRLIPSCRHKDNTNFMVAPHVGAVREPPLQFG